MVLPIVFSMNGWRLIGTFTVDDAGSVTIKMDRRNPDGAISEFSTGKLAFDAGRIVPQVKEEVHTIDKRSRTTKIEAFDEFGKGRTVD